MEKKVNQFTMLLISAILLIVVVYGIIYFVQGDWQPYEVIYRTTFDDMEVVLSQRGNNIKLKIDGQIVGNNSKFSTDKSHVFSYSECNIKYTSNGKVIHPIEKFTANQIDLDEKSEGGSEEPFIMETSYCIYHFDATQEIICDSMNGQPYITKVSEKDGWLEDKEVDKQEVDSFISDLKAVEGEINLDLYDAEYILSINQNFMKTSFIAGREYCNSETYWVYQKENDAVLLMQTDHRYDEDGEYKQDINQKVYQLSDDDLTKWIEIIKE